MRDLILLVTSHQFFIKRNKNTYFIEEIKNILLFTCKLKFLIIFDAMKFGTLYIWSWRSPKI